MEHIFTFTSLFLLFIISLFLQVKCVYKFLMFSFRCVHDESSYKVQDYSNHPLSSQQPRVTVAHHISSEKRERQLVVVKVDGVVLSVSD